MTLLAVERIKLFSTRSPYWCLAIIIAVALLFALLMGTVEGGQHATTFLSQVGLPLGMMVMMVLSALSMTSEYRFGTIRATFLAEPRRTRVLMAKTGLLIVIAAVVAAISSFAAFFLTKALASSPDQPLELSSGSDWRIVLGHIALYPIAAVIAVSVGTLVRQSAGAIAILLVWALLVGTLVTLIPSVGRDISEWLPFEAASRFVSVPDGAGAFRTADALTGGPTPVEGLLVFLGAAIVLWVAALIMLRRRDA